LASLKKVRSIVRSLLPQADTGLVDHLTAKAGEELGGGRCAQAARRRKLSTEIARIIQREEMSELGIK
jgi:hypothetical protein